MFQLQLLISDTILNSYDKFGEVISSIIQGSVQYLDIEHGFP